MECWDYTDHKYVIVSKDSQVESWVCHSIPGFPGYLSKRVHGVYVESWDVTEYVVVSQDSQDTYPRGTRYVYYTEYVIVSQDSQDTYPRGTRYVESWDYTEYVIVSRDLSMGYTVCGILGLC